MSWYSGGRGERLRKVMNHDFKTRGGEEKSLARRHSLPFSLIKYVKKNLKSWQKDSFVIFFLQYFRLRFDKNNSHPSYYMAGKRQEIFSLFGNFVFLSLGKMEHLCPPSDAFFVGDRGRSLVHILFDRCQEEEERQQQEAEEG